MWSILKSSGHERCRRGRLNCSFCGRDASAVERLVAGASAYICDACITDCVAILERHGGFTPPVSDQRRSTH